KAFRVFNSRTRIVQETLHVIFIENKPNVAGSGPAWLFDIDSLSQTMNYHPVLAENQSNTHAGFQETKKAGEEGTQTYVLFLVLSDGSTNPKNNNKDALVDGKEHDDNIQKSVSPDIHSLSCGDQTRKQGDKAENKDKVNAAGSSVSATGLNFTNITNDLSVAGPSNAAMPNLEDLSHNADDIGLQVKQKKDGIFISQDKYVAEILRKFGLSKGKSASTPIDAEKPLLKDSDGKDVDVNTYRSMIGSLMYLTSSRPDIMFAQCKKQTVVATSSTEAKYVAAASGCAQVLWMQN
nr:retrotransposon protein, putative, Ty1-copia subclass [Tanacetum cinerariifolium]